MLGENSEELESGPAGQMFLILKRWLELEKLGLPLPDSKLLQEKNKILNLYVNYINF
jgi:hypothetical protein